MSKTNDGGYVYPVVASDSKDISQDGMTLRCHFAGQALQGLCANPGGPFQENSRSGWGLVNCAVGDIAVLAYELADAMIKAREVFYE